MKKHPYIARHTERLSTEQGFRKRSPHPTPSHPWEVEGFKVFLVPRDVFGAFLSPNFDFICLNRERGNWKAHSFKKTMSKASLELCWQEKVSARPLVRVRRVGKKLICGPFPQLSVCLGSVWLLLPRSHPVFPPSWRPSQSTVGWMWSWEPSCPSSRWSANKGSLQWAQRIMAAKVKGCLENTLCP